MENIFNISNDVLSVESFEYWLKEYFNGLNWEKELNEYDINRILKKSLNKLFSDFNFKEEKLSKILKYYDITIAHSLNIINFVRSETKTKHKIIIRNEVCYLIEDKENGLPIANHNGPKFKYYVDDDSIDIRLTLKNKNNLLPKRIELFTIGYFDGEIEGVYSNLSHKIDISVQLEYYIYYAILNRICRDISLLIDIYANTQDFIEKIKKVLHYTESSTDTDYSILNYKTFNTYSNAKIGLKDSIKFLKIIPLKNLKINNMMSLKELEKYVNA